MKPSCQPAALHGLPGPEERTGFTLIELLVVVAIIGVLAALLLPALASCKERSRICGCASNMRQIGLAMRMYADDHQDEFPRSQHSAFAHGTQPWGLLLAPGLGAKSTAGTDALPAVYRCPSHRKAPPWSYGLNVYLEVSPDADDYAGSPQTWRHAENVPSPSATILLAEVPGTADHVMPHFWTTLSDCTDVDACRHGGKANYLFVDNHVECLRLQDTYDPQNHVDRWNPRAR